MRVLIPERPSFHTGRQWVDAAGTTSRPRSTISNAGFPASRFRMIDEQGASAVTSASSLPAKRFTISPHRCRRRRTVHRAGAERRLGRLRSQRFHFPGGCAGSRPWRSQASGICHRLCSKRLWKKRNAPPVVSPAASGRRWWVPAMAKIAEQAAIADGCRTRRRERLTASISPRIAAKRSSSARRSAAGNRRAQSSSKRGCRAVQSAHQPRGVSSSQPSRPPRQQPNSAVSAGISTCHLRNMRPRFGRRNHASRRTCAPIVNTRSMRWLDQPPARSGIRRRCAPPRGSASAGKIRRNIPQRRLEIEPPKSIHPARKPRRLAGRDSPMPR